MKKFIMVLFVVGAAMLLVAPAYATELWDFQIRGINEGLATGALPPPGLYFIDDNVMAPNYHGFGGANPSGHVNTDTHLFAYVNVPVLLWVPGCKFLGADYAMGIAEPFDYTNLRVGNGNTGYSTGAQWGAYNTVLVPYVLSWKLPCDWHIATGLNIGLNDPTSSPATADTLGSGPFDAFAPSGNGYYTFAPTLGLSWLHAGWNLSVGLNYSINTKDNGTDYTSGNMLAVNYTATYTYGKWTFGVGAGEESQLTTDSDRFGSIPDSKAEVWTAGPIIGYNFGPCSLQFIYNFPIYTNNDVGGEWFDVRFVVPLWH
jgi:hypothetical protein